MSGYTPLFQSLTTGTLCGKWPDIGLWPIVLSLSDKHGIVDVTPAYLASITGLALDEVVGCMRRFSEPDPYSRSVEHGGARLALIDPDARNWGWQVINHGKYREKARKHSFDAARVADGRNAARMADRRDPTRPAKTRADPPSDSNTNTDSNSKSLTAAAPPTRKTVSRETVDWQLDFKLAYPFRAGDPNWRGAWKAANARIAEGHTPEEFIAGAHRYAEFIQATGKVGTEFVQQASRFLGPSKPFLQQWLAPARQENAMDRVMRATGGTKSDGRTFDHEEFAALPR